ncbi:MAG: HAD family hydrolase [Thaumarchaeota archaeon]|nr:HAD family hydrolase [Nitrososphaerota archaeon]
MSNLTQKAVFFDRDGTLTEDPLPPGSLEDLKIVPDARKYLLTLKEKGYILVMVTNQPDVKRGLLTREFIDLTNEKICDTLPLDRVFVCPHSDEDKCECRKPKPGMLLQAAKELGIDLKKSIMVGDRKSDIDAGKAAGCRTVYVNHSQSLKDAVDWILEVSE